MASMRSTEERRSPGRASLDLLHVVAAHNAADDGHPCDDRGPASVWYRMDDWPTHEKCQRLAEWMLGLQTWMLTCLDSEVHDRVRCWQHQTLCQDRRKCNTRADR
eukprot:2067688-Rhodomonas_salina.2